MGIVNEGCKGPCFLTWLMCTYVLALAAEMQVGCGLVWDASL